MKVKDLIEAHNKTYSTYYMGTLYSHTPMALVALERIGASSDRLVEFYKHDTKKLEPKKNSSLVINDENWKLHLGEIECEYAYVSYFKEMISKGNSKTVIREYFDFLMRGVGAAAFHPLIRLFYGVDTSNDEEVAISLGTWAASFVDLGEDSVVSGKESILTILADLQEAQFNDNQKIEAVDIAQRMQVVSEKEDYKSIWPKVSYEALKKENLQESLLWLFAQSNNFTLLHGVTSHQAFEALAQFSSNEREARSYFWKAALAAYLSTTGHFKLDLNWVYPKVELLSWQKIKALAVKSNDDHTVKLIYTLSCSEESPLDYELRYAATIELGILSD